MVRGKEIVLKMQEINQSFYWNINIYRRKTEGLAESQVYLILVY